MLVILPEINMLQTTARIFKPVIITACLCFVISFPLTASAGSSELSIKRIQSNSSCTSLTEPVRQKLWNMVFKQRELLKEQLKAALNTYLENPDSARISLSDEPPGRLLGGRFKEITVELKGSKVDSLRVDYGYLKVFDCTLDMAALIEHRKFKLIDEGHNEFLLKFTEEDLNRIFQEKQHSLKISNPRLDLRPGHVRFSGGVHILFFNNKVKVDGIFKVRNGDELHFNPRWMNLGIMPVPQFILSKIRRSINPIASISHFKFKISMDTVRITNRSFIIASKGMNDLAKQLAEQDSFNNKH
jgi:hypothetical protein